VRPIATYDSEYGNASFVKQTAGIAADLYCDYARTSACAPPPYSGKGRPKLHGDKFKLSDSSTWSEPVAILVEDQSGQVKIQQWLGLHFRQQQLTRCNC